MDGICWYKGIRRVGRREHVRFLLSMCFDWPYTSIDEDSGDPADKISHGYFSSDRASPILSVHWVSISFGGMGVLWVTSLHPPPPPPLHSLMKARNTEVLASAVSAGGTVEQ